VRKPLAANRKGVSNRDTLFANYTLCEISGLYALFPILLEASLPKRVLERRSVLEDVAEEYHPTVRHIHVLV
jgi:hypothetical protein